MLCRTLTGLFRKSASQPAHGPPVHPSDSGKAVLPSLPGSSPLPSSRKSHTTQAAPAAWASCTSPHARNCAPSPFFPGRSSIRSRESRPNIPEDMCSSCCSPFHGDTGTRLYPAAIPCSLTLYMLCKRQWDHGIHRRPPKAELAESI